MDNTILYLANDKSAREAVKTLEDVSHASGFRVNKKKTLYKFLGQWKKRTGVVGEFSLCTGPVEVLGVHFGDGYCK